MSPPSISFSPLPPNLFITSALIFLFTHTPTVLATPFPKGGGAGSGGHGSGGGRSVGSYSASSGAVASASSSSTTISNDNKPLSKGEIAGVIVGTILGTFLVLVIAFICTNIDWCIRKELQFRDWMDARKAARRARGKGRRRLQKNATSKEATAVINNEQHKDDVVVVKVVEEEIENGRERNEDEWDSATDVPDEEYGSQLEHQRCHEDGELASSTVHLYIPSMAADVADSRNNINPTPEIITTEEEKMERKHKFWWI